MRNDLVHWLKMADDESESTTQVRWVIFDFLWVVSCLAGDPEVARKIRHLCRRVCWAAYKIVNFLKFVRYGGQGTRNVQASTTYKASAMYMAIIRLLYFWQNCRVNFLFRSKLLILLSSRSLNLRKWCWLNKRAVDNGRNEYLPIMFADSVC